MSALRIFNSLHLKHHMFFANLLSSRHNAASAKFEYLAVRNCSADRATLPPKRKRRVGGMVWILIGIAVLFAIGGAFTALRKNVAPPPTIGARRSRNRASMNLKMRPGRRHIRGCVAA